MEVYFKHKTSSLSRWRLRRRSFLMFECGLRKYAQGLCVCLWYMHWDTKSATPLTTTTTQHRNIICEPAAATHIHDIGCHRRRRFGHHISQRHTQHPHHTNRVWRTVSVDRRDCFFLPRILGKLDVFAVCSCACDYIVVLKHYFSASD